MKVLILVAANFHAQYGFSLDIYDIDPNYTLGDMAAKLAKIRDILTQEKIINNNKLLPMPKDFLRIAVISPEQAAGLGDFQREANLLAKYNLCEFTYYTAVFQGKIAPNSLIEALNQAMADQAVKNYDVIVIIRGGGAVADLAWLNDLNLARTICLSSVKVMAGIGHERDFTIIDEVAGLKFDTPSKVINYIFQVITNNAKQAALSFMDIVSFSNNLILQAENKVNYAYENLRVLIIKSTELEQTILNQLLAEIQRLAKQSIINGITNIEQIMQYILALGPMAVQKRGFVIVKNTAGIILSSKVETSNYTDLLLQFHDGEILVKKV